MNIYVDPGKHASGVAWFHWRALVNAQLVPAAEPLPTYPGSYTIRCEKPVVRKGSRERPADLIDLAIAAGRMTGANPCTYITPESWKGQIPCTCTAKNTPRDCTHHRRMWAALTPDERALLTSERCNCARGALHNVYDAVTMGLRFEGRL